jgi:outer membrane lipoprotein-sorting protein
MKLTCDKVSIKIFQNILTARSAVIMKNLVRYVLTALVCAFVFNATTANAQDQLMIRELYKKMDANLKTLSTLKTGVQMEKYNSQLKEVEDRRRGQALIIPVKGSRDANFRLEWTQGAKETLSVVNGKYRLYQPNAGQIIEGKSKDAQKSGKGTSSAFKLISMSAADLKANFNADWLGIEENVGGVHSAYKMKLTPKTAADFNYAEVWVNGDGMVVQFKVYDKNGDWTNVLLFDIARNAKISKNDVANINAPAGTKVVKG